MYSLFCLSALGPPPEHRVAVRLQRPIPGPSASQLDAPLLKTVHIPKSMMAAPFLQYPELTAGQKKYLCSIANIYSTEGMRALIRRQYATMLPERTSHHVFHENRYPQRTRNESTAQRITKAEVEHGVKRLGSCPAHTQMAQRGKTILPRIVDHRQRKKTSSAATSQSKTRTANTSIETSKSLKDTYGKESPEKEDLNQEEESLDSNTSILVVEEMKDSDAQDVDNGSVNKEDGEAA
ncbi:F216A protein, partial [Polypterus senegalus]